MAANPIPYADETVATFSPCRVLFSGGEWKVPEGERPANWRERETPVEVAPQKRPERDIAARQKEAAAITAEVKRRAGRPRKNPPKQHPHAGKGKAWNRIDRVTNEQIAELRKSGLSFSEIGKRLGINSSTAYNRLMRAKIVVECQRNTTGTMGRGVARPDVTLEMILELRRAGKCAREICAQLRCNRKLFYKRLKEAK